MKRTIKIKAQSKNNELLDGMEVATLITFSENRHKERPFEFKRMCDEKTEKIREELFDLLRKHFPITDIKL